MFAKKLKWQAKRKLYQKWLAHKLLSDLPRSASRQWDRFDPDDVLHPMGLSIYKPARVSVGGIGVFILGALAGSIVGLLLAPKTGVELRTEVKDKARNYLHRTEEELKERTASA